MWNEICRSEFELVWRKQKAAGGSQDRRAWWLRRLLDDTNIGRCTPTSGKSVLCRALQFVSLRAILDAVCEHIQFCWSPFARHD